MSSMIFPLPFVPAQSYRGGLGWNADRSKVAKAANEKAGYEKIPGGILRHAAVDLMAPFGTPVLAMDEGEVLGQPYFFFDNTWAIEIAHPKFLARYCEINRVAEVKKGDLVKPGQVIGYVGDQSYWAGDMLHLELYSGKTGGNLTTDYSAKNAPFYRRKDVFDPTATLDSIRGTAIRDLRDKYNYEEDADKRKFLKKYSLEDL